MATDFPQSGDDEPISLGNSRFDVFDHSYARDLKRNHPDIWGAGGNIRGNEAFEIWKRAERGVSSPAVLAWIKEREAGAPDILKMANNSKMLTWGQTCPMLLALLPGEMGHGWCAG